MCSADENGVSLAKMVENNVKGKISVLSVPRNADGKKNTFSVRTEFCNKYEPCFNIRFLSSEDKPNVNSHSDTPESHT